MQSVRRVLREHADSDGSNPRQEHGDHEDPVFEGPGREPRCGHDGGPEDEDGRIEDGRARSDAEIADVVRRDAV